jgi:hypothetical protein
MPINKNWSMHLIANQHKGFESKQLSDALEHVWFGLRGM